MKYFRTGALYQSGNALGNQVVCYFGYSGEKSMFCVISEIGF